MGIIDNRLSLAGSGTPASVTTPRSLHHAVRIEGDGGSDSGGWEVYKGRIELKMVAAIISELLQMYYWILHVHK